MRYPMHTCSLLFTGLEYNLFDMLVVWYLPLVYACQELKTIKPRIGVQEIPSF